MLRERVVWIVAIVLVAAVGFFSGQYVGVRNGEQNRASAANRFFAQRGGQNGPGGQGFAGRGMAGTVSAVSGSTVTLTTRGGQTVTVDLAPDATVRKQVDGQVSDIKQGEQIVAFGAQDGNTFKATSVQIGGFGGGRNAVVAPAP